MLLGPHALRKRLPLLIAFVLAALLVGAGLAALQKPTFRSAATVNGPADLATIVRSGDVAVDFRNRVAARYGSEFATSVVTFASGSGERIELSTESQFAGVAEDLTALYAEAVLATSPDVQLVEPASFPVSPTSPNLRRTALTSFILGAGWGWVAIVLLERRSPTMTSTVDESTVSTSPVPAPLAALLDETRLQPDDEPVEVAAPEAPAPESPALQAEPVRAPRIGESAVARDTQVVSNPLEPKPVAEVPRIVKLPDQN